MKIQLWKNSIWDFKLCILIFSDQSVQDELKWIFLLYWQFEHWKVKMNRRKYKSWIVQFQNMNFTGLKSDLKWESISQEDSSRRQLGSLEMNLLKFRYENIYRINCTLTFEFYLYFSFVSILSQNQRAYSDKPDRE